MVTNMPASSVVASRSFTLMAAAVLLCACAGPGSSSAQRTVTVRGVAELEVAPDHVVVTLRVHSLDKDITAAKAANDKSVKNLASALHDLQIAAEDIETGYVRVAPSYDHTQSGRVFEGYGVTRTVVVTVRQLDSYSVALTASLEAGATHIDQVVFRTTELRKHRDAARAQAAQAAREKAAALAAELGASLGEVVEIDEVPGWYGRSLTSNVILGEDAFVQGDDTMNAGMLSVKSAVQVSFELE